MALTALLLLVVCVSSHAFAEAETNSFQEWIRMKRTGATQCCTVDALDELRDTLQNDLDFISQSVLEVGFNLQEFINLGMDAKYPASSCSSLFYTKPYMPSGDYWLGEAKHSPKKMHCVMDMHNPTMGPTQGWLELVNLDVTDKRQQCPDGFRVVEQQGKRLCEKKVDRGCQSIVLSSYGVQYSRVCGKASGFQIGTNNAFFRYECDHCTIDGPYIDGISITHGKHPRKHIWSLATSWTDYRDDSYRAVCPCAKGRGPQPPSFVGNNYYCETGQYWPSKKRFDAEDPLWDGQGCSDGEKDCCKPADLPWFCVDLPRGTTDDVEVRVCADERKSNEDLYLESLQIIVQ